jgi:hypothetical protein
VPIQVPVLLGGVEPSPRHVATQWTPYRSRKRDWGRVECSPAPYLSSLRLGRRAIRAAVAAAVLALADHEERVGVLHERPLLLAARGLAVRPDVLQGALRENLEVLRDRVEGLGDHAAERRHRDGLAAVGVEEVRDRLGDLRLLRLQLRLPLDRSRAERLNRSLDVDLAAREDEIRGERSAHDVYSFFLTRHATHYPGPGNRENH